MLPRVGRVRPAGRRGSGTWDCGRCAGEDLGGQRRGTAQPAAALVLVGLGHQPLEQLAHDAEREALLELGGPGREHAEAELGRASAGRFEQPRLPDPGGALDDQHAALSLPDGAQRGMGALQFQLALEQCGRTGPGKCVHALGRSYGRGTPPRNGVSTPVVAGHAGREPGSSEGGVSKISATTALR